MSANTLVKNMLTEKASGSMIAKKLRENGFTADESMDALLDAGFCVSRENAGWGVVLHISGDPNESLRDTATSLMGNLFGGGAEVAWRN